MKTENLDDEDLIEMEFDSEMNDKVVRFFCLINKLENQCKKESRKNFRQNLNLVINYYFISFYNF